MNTLRFKVKATTVRTEIVLRLKRAPRLHLRGELVQFIGEHAQRIGATIDGHLLLIFGQLNLQEMAWSIHKQQSPGVWPVMIHVSIWMDQSIRVTDFGTISSLEQR